MPMQIGIGISLTLTEDDGVAGVGSGPAGDGILLEDNTSFLLAENNDYLIQE